MKDANGWINYIILNMMGIFVNDKTWNIKQAKENYEWEKWHLKRAQEAGKRGDKSTANDHISRAKSIKRTIKVWD